jgi:hypothetical protein
VLHKKSLSLAIVAQALLALAAGDLFVAPASAAPLNPFGAPFTGYAQGTLVNGPAGEFFAGLIANVFDPEHCGLAEGTLLTDATSSYTFQAMAASPPDLLALDIHLLISGSQNTGINSPPGTIPFVDLSTSVGFPVASGAPDYEHVAALDTFTASLVATGRSHGGTTIDAKTSNPAAPNPAVVAAQASNTAPPFGVNPFMSMSWEYDHWTYVSRNGGPRMLVDQFQLHPALGNGNVTVDRTLSLEFALIQPTESFQVEEVSFLRLTTECAGCVPEPSTHVLFGAGIGFIGLAYVRRRRRTRV